MNPKTGMDVDHINGDTLDNRTENLRICTRQQNSANSAYRKNMTTKGVSYDKARDLWKSYIKVNYRQIFLGRFKEKKDALNAYRVASERHFGAFSFARR